MVGFISSDLSQQNEQLLKQEELKERLRADLLPINEKALKIGLREGKKLKKNIDEYYTY